MSFTDAEVQSSVSEFVRSDVKQERDLLGPLDVDQTFLEVREFTSSTLVFDPNAIFYLIYLATNRVNQDVLSALEKIQDLTDAILEVGEFTEAVTQTSLLGDAAAALLEVDRLIIANNAITERPFTRYVTALDQFTDVSLTPNMSRTTVQAFPNVREIVRPPPQARESIKTLIDEMRELHTTTIAEAEQLAEILTEFLAAALPTVAVQNSVRSVRQDLDALKGEFDAETEEGAIGMTRDAFLRIKAGQSVITNLTSITDPTDPRMEGTLVNAQRAQSAYVSGVSDADPAEVVAARSAPWHIIPSVQDQVLVSVDGGIDQLVTIVPPDPASLQGVIGETFDIHAAQAASLSTAAGPYTVPAAPDNVFDISIDGVPFSATLTDGVRTAAQVAAEIDPVLTTATASDSSGTLLITHDTVGEGSIVIGNKTILNTALGFTDGQDSDSLPTTRGVDANNELRFIVDTINAIVIPLVGGTARTAAQIAAEIVAASVLINASAETVGSDIVVKVSSESYGEGSHIKAAPTTPTQEETLRTLGLALNGESRSTYVSMSALKTALGGISGVELEEELSAMFSGVDGSAVLDGSDYKLRLPTGTIPAADPPTINDRVAILTGDNSGSYPITAVSLGGAFDEFTLGRPLSAVSGTESLNQSWEIRRDLLTTRSLTEDLDSSLNVKAASANTELGLTVGEIRGKTSSVVVKDAGVSVNFVRSDVVEDDLFAFLGPTIATEHTIQEVTEDDFQIEVDPKIDNNVSSQLFKISSASAEAYAVFAAALDLWINTTLANSQFEDDLLDLERKLNPLLSNKRPSKALINDAKASATSLQQLYESLQVVLKDYSVDVVPRIDAVLDMLIERGLDRGHDLLLLGELTEFFSLNKDSASYSGNLLEKSRDIAQNDVPVGTGDEEDHLDTRLTGEMEDDDPDFDFSDRDEEFENTEVDDVPDEDDEDDILNSAL